METAVALFIDPSCPFAWITSRWLREVLTVREVRLDLGLVSLSVINEGRELEPWYREFNDRAWGPSRVAAAIMTDHGASALDAFYDAFGRRWHAQERRDLDPVLTEAVHEAGLPGTLAGEASAAERDAELRTWTARALEPVHEDVGTPVIHLAGRAFFGPVLTSVPRGEDAGRLFDAVCALIGEPRFCELKRGRTEDLVLA
jgi:hypothetical protein